MTGKFLYGVAIMKGFFVSLLVSTLCLISSGAALATTSSKCPGEQGYTFTNNRDKNPTRGGFIGNGAYVSESAFIAPTAAVCESATVEAGVRVMGNAIVKGEAIVEGSVRIMGDAIVGGTAYITGERSNPTLIRGYARIFSGEITSGRHGNNSKPEDVLKKEAANNARENAEIRFKENSQYVSSVMDRFNYHGQLGNGYSEGNRPGGNIFEVDTKNNFEKCYIKAETTQHFEFLRKVDSVLNAFRHRLAVNTHLNKVKNITLDLDYDVSWNIRFYFGDNQVVENKRSRTRGKKTETKEARVDTYGPGQVGNSGKTPPTGTLSESEASKLKKSLEEMLRFCNSEATVTIRG